MRTFNIEAKFGAPASTLHDFARAHALAIPGNIVYTYIPKNACTSLRIAAGRANGFSGDLSNIQSSIQASFEQVQCAEYTFVVLREPFERIASVFLDKAIREPKRFTCLLTRFERRINRLSGRNADATLDKWSFRTFVERLAVANNIFKEHHWVPQNAFLLYESYDDYFDVKDMAATFETLSKRFAVEDTRRGSGHTTLGKERVTGMFADTTVKDLRQWNKAGKVPNYDSMYDEDVRRVVRTLYQEDFALYFDKCQGMRCVYPNITSMFASSTYPT